MSDISNFKKSIVFFVLSTVLISVHTISVSILLTNNIRYADDYYNYSIALIIGLIFLTIGFFYFIKEVISKFKKRNVGDIEKNII